MVHAEFHLASAEMNLSDTLSVNANTVNQFWAPTHATSADGSARRRCRWRSRSSFNAQGTAAAADTVTGYFTLAQAISTSGRQNFYSLRDQISYTWTTLAEVRRRISLNKDIQRRC